MATTVINLNDRLNARYDVYIGRPGNHVPTKSVKLGRPGYFGNPYEIYGSRKRIDAIRLFVGYATARVQNDAEYREAIRGLKGKVLGCFCKPLPCHGDILAQMADSCDD